jgi:hypothetical protein
MGEVPTVRNGSIPQSGCNEQVDFGSSKVYRQHIVGRISCLARLPIYGLGLILLVLKTAVKIPIAFVVTPIAACFGKKGSWTFSGVAKDAIMVGSLMDRMGCTALCVICAPPKEYRSFGCAASDTFKLVTKARYQKSEIKDLFCEAILLRPQYDKCIIDQGNNQIFHDVLLLKNLKNSDDEEIRIGNQKFHKVLIWNTILAG